MISVKLLFYISMSLSTGGDYFTGESVSTSCLWSDVSRTITRQTQGHGALK